RVLVDHYHDAGEQYIRTNLRGGLVQPTICREALTWSVLKHYHVAIIDATGPSEVGANELRAVERFVAEGGGLLIAGSAPQYELVTGASPARMPAARFAERFGFRFLSAAQARGEVQFDPELRIGYHDRDVEAPAGVVEGFGPHPPGLESCAPLEIPANAHPLIVHAKTGEPLAAVADHAAGRVCVCPGPLTRFNVLAHLQPLIAWLADGAGERPGEDVPSEMGRPTVHQIRDLTLICDPQVADRAEELATLVRRADSFMADLMGERWKSKKTLHFAQTSHRPRPWEEDDFLPAAGPDPAVAYVAATALAVDALWHGPQGDLLVSLFPEATVARHIGMRFLDHLGYTEEAERLRERAARALEAADPTRRADDLARVYWATEQWHPKGEWLLSELERRRAQRAGDDFLRRLFEVLPKKRDEDPLPQTWAWRADRLAYYLGLAAGEDVTGLLREIGTTIHPLPLIPPDDGDFDAEMRRTLAEAVLAQNDRIGPTRRMEALSDLSRLKPEQRAELPARVRELTEAFERSAASDVRAVAPLETLARDGEPSQAAWAALQLVTMGRDEWADRLAELLPASDIRFRLMAGHALRRIGREAPEGSLEGLIADGKRVGELDVMVRDVVMIHPKVDGYEIANVLGESGMAGFPHGNLATQFYVYWVHTLPQWRRSGLSRLAFSAAMAHPEAQRCSCFALNTGARNSAHALYREFAFVDMDRRESATRQLHAGTACTPPDGVVIRPLADADRETVRSFMRDYHADAFTLSLLPMPDLGAGTFTALAERDGRLTGAALAEYTEGDGAALLDVAVLADEDDRPEIGVALLARVHAMLAGAGAKRVTAHVCSDAGLLTDVLGRAGYSRETSGGVNMFGIRDLAQLSEEIRPLYERRLRETPFEDWRGRVLLVGERLNSGFEIEDGEVRVLHAPKPGPTDIVLRSTDERITRIVTGRETPVEGYLQREMAIEPQVSPAVMKLLETLFPHVPFLLRWGW
ncbi:MAG: hypothetical protein ACOCX2_12930, partial [Armatimonadota bacterium]